jgi:5-methylcytosine-specific restriction enzyme B
LRFLLHTQKEGDKFFIPENVHIIGTMNTADRSLAMVDYALRRRFCFIDLVPRFKSQKFRDFLQKHGVRGDQISNLVRTISDLNQAIADDGKNLGRGFCIGHSYFCPSCNGVSLNDAWFKRVIRNEIKPLLMEYWFDSPEKVEIQIKKLMEIVAE